MRRISRPQGEHTRGKTATNRLRQIDVYVALAMPEVLRGASPLAVDLGFGAAAWTTLEMAERWRRIEPSLRALGVEIDPERVAAAKPFADPPATRFELGGFNLTTVLGTERARIVRCYNVLRQYDESAVTEALTAIAGAVERGGVIVEGTSNPSGSMVAFDVWRVGAGGTIAHGALVLGTNFSHDFEPRDFQTILPKRLIHRMLDEEPARFFDDWRRARAIARGHGAGASKRAWVATAELLRTQYGWPIDPRRRLAERGYLVVRKTLGGSPA
jgi:hypothetical protein